MTHTQQAIYIDELVIAFGGDGGGGGGGGGGASFTDAGGGYAWGNDGYDSWSSDHRDSWSSESYAGLGTDGARGCTSKDTQASCKARETGYTWCSRLGTGLTTSMEVTGFKTLSKAAELVEPFCNNVIDKGIDLYHKTPMWEKEHGPIGSNKGGSFTVTSSSSSLSGGYKGA